MSKAIVFLVLLFVSPAVFAATPHTVGGSSGWNNNVNYDRWASGLTFVTDDSLVFNYDPTHAVDEVTEADYTSCNTGGNVISSDSNSPTTISLTATGMRYFICPRSNHCLRGMKLAVNVTAGSTSPGAPSPPSGGNTPPAPGGNTPPVPGDNTPPVPGDSPSPPSGTPRTPTSTPAPPPPAGGAATTLGGRTSYIGGLLLVLVAMFMG